MNRFFRSALFPLFVIVVLVYLASQTLLPHSKSARKATYSDFISAVSNNNVRSAEFNPGKRSISYVETDGTKASIHYPADQAVPQLTTLMKDHDVKFDSKGTGGFSWVGILVSMLPFVILIAFWIFLMNQVQGGGSKVMSFGKSRAKRMAPDSPKIGFKDVAGVDEAVEELQEIKEFLENPKKFQALGARIPKGVLLFGKSVSLASHTSRTITMSGKNALRKKRFTGLCGSEYRTACEKPSPAGRQTPSGIRSSWSTPTYGRLR